MYLRQLDFKRFFEKELQFSDCCMLYVAIDLRISYCLHMRIVRIFASSNLKYVKIRIM